MVDDNFLNEIKPECVILAFCYIEMLATRKRSVGALNLPMPLNQTDDN